MDLFSQMGKTMTLKCFLLTTSIALYTMGAASASPHEDLSPLPKHGPSTVLITKFIDQYHYKASRLNDQQSNQVFTEYLNSLDANRNIFTQKDLDRFSKYKFSLDDALLRGDLNPAFDIFKVFNTRRIERAKFAISLLETKFDFSIDETYRFDRKDAEWPKDKAALDELWRKRVKNDFLTMLLAKKDEKDFKKTLKKRYERLITRSNQFKAEDAYELFINAYLRSVEPHTAYLSPRTSENFNINMSLSLEGIGAALQMEDDYTVVKRIIPGGPASESGLLHVDDKIIGVGQGRKGKVIDVVGWRLDDVVDKIRGPKDTTVQLHISPKNSGIDGPDTYITLVRNKIKLEDQKVKKSIIEVPTSDKVRKIGVIDIPMFYMDFAAASRGEKDFSSTTRDAQQMLAELKAEKVDGIVVDLRGNGGGSLSEAVSLTGMFIKSGPVVQIRSSSGEVQLNEDEDERIDYTGPLIVLVDRYSASASEIFSGAIQDYGRGTIVGEPTFGKGTVQTIIDLNQYVRGNSDTLGKLKLTMAQFYRINGDSTQHRGVVPDIIYPTAIVSNEIGERALKNALPWAKISPTAFTPVSTHQVNMDEIREKHERRVELDSGFEFLLAQAEVRKEVLDKKEVSLIKSKRQDERKASSESNNERLNKFRVSRGMPTVALNEDEDEDKEKQELLREELQLVELREAATILVDLIH